MRRGPARDIVRDLLWKNIPLEPAAARVVDTPAFQRLRYVRQLGHAFLVYPGATHSRFEHALGVYHLARRALDGLAERGDLDGFAPDDALLIRLGALLHDVGHYPFSHALEEDGAASHETLAATHLRRPPLAAALAETGLDAPVERLDALIRGTSPHPLAGLIAGSLDLDKIDYLKRDALMSRRALRRDRRGPAAGLPRGGGRGRAPLGGDPREGAHGAGVPAVRQVPDVPERLLAPRRAERDGDVQAAGAGGDGGAGARRRRGSPTPPTTRWSTSSSASDGTGLAVALRERRLHKRALEIAPGGPAGAAARLGRRGRRAGWRAPRTRSRRASASAPARVLVDFPHKAAMLGVDLAIVRRDGAVDRLGRGGWPGRIDLPRLADDLAESARRLRVFAARPATVRAADLFDVLAGGGSGLASRACGTVTSCVAIGSAGRRPRRCPPGRSPR